ncbi:peptidylprolyl isomerase [Acidocella sp.]|uniref:peptidylprolyl isomerase n=1 Tax=Acidocella sp. TaxID=50710 RepID=UPI00261AD3C4|nr:peptidylprolyl isomerase [Acidocella sp.]
MKCLLRAVLLAMAWAGPVLAQKAAQPPAPSADSVGVAAVVNGQVITTQDVANRARLLALSMGMTASPDVIQHLMPQVTQQLIDQALQQQEIDKLGITVSNQDIADALSHIEQGNNIPPGGLQAKLEATGVPYSALLAQIRTGLGWQQVLHRVLGPGLQPTPGDIAAQKAALKASLGATQYHLAEIFIRVTDPSDETTARNFANTVINQLRQGAPFPIVAAQFSQAQTALAGGDLGYVQLSQLDPEVAATVKEMPVGAISNPIRVPGGYEIVQLLDKHDEGNQLQTILDMRQAFGRYPQPVTGGQLGPVQINFINQFMTKAQAAKSCADIEALNTAYGNIRPANPGPVNLATVTPPAFQQVLASLPLNTLSRPLVQADGVSVVMICNRSQQKAQLPPDDQIVNIIIERRVALESQQMMDQLRHRSVILQPGSS